MPQLQLQGYFRHNDCIYRINVNENGAVWVERQQPRAFAGNIQIVIEVDDLLYGRETWRLDQIAPLLDRYEEIYARDED